MCRGGEGVKLPALSYAGIKKKGSNGPVWAGNLRAEESLKIPV